MGQEFKNNLVENIYRINNYRADPSGWIGSIIMFIFAVIAGYRWFHSGFIFFGLLIFRDLSASWFLISRKPSKDKINPRLYEVLAYFSSAWPLIYLDPQNSLSKASLVSPLIAIVGFTISTLAVLDLGSSFGISPANRGVVRTGLYRYVRHPMYSGYAIAEFGFVFLNPINIIIYCFSMCLYFIRAKTENSILEN